MGREIHLERREMVFSWISVSGNGGMGRNHGREIQLNVFMDFCQRKWRDGAEPWEGNPAEPP